MGIKLGGEGSCSAVQRSREVEAGRVWVTRATPLLLLMMLVLAPLLHSVVAPPRTFMRSTKTRELMLAHEPPLCGYTDSSGGRLMPVGVRRRPQASSRTIY